MAFLRRTWERTIKLYRVAISERATPRQVAVSVTLGTFIGCTPALGFHGWIALAAASLLKLNRLYCWVGSRVCNVVTLPFVMIAEVQVGHFLRTRAFVTVDRDTILARAPALVGDWLIGLVPVGGSLALLLGLLAFGIAKLRARRNLALADQLSHNCVHDRPERDRPHRTPP